LGAAWGGERGGEPAAGRSNDEARGRRAGRRVSLFFDKSVLEVRIALVLGPWPAVHGEGGRLRSHGAPPALVGPVWSGRGEPRGRRRLQSAGVQRARARARERESERARERKRQRESERDSARDSERDGVANALDSTRLLPTMAAIAQQVAGTSWASPMYTHWVLGTSMQARPGQGGGPKSGRPERGNLPGRRQPRASQSSARMSLVCVPLRWRRA